MSLSRFLLFLIWINRSEDHAVVISQGVQTPQNAWRARRIAHQALLPPLLTPVKTKGHRMRRGQVEGPVNQLLFHQQDTAPKFLPRLARVAALAAQNCGRRMPPVEAPNPLWCWKGRFQTPTPRIPRTAPRVPRWKPATSPPNLTSSTQTLSSPAHNSEASQCFFSFVPVFTSWPIL